MQQSLEAPLQLLVLDPRLPGWTRLLTAAHERTLVLDTERPGLRQMAEVAEERAPLRALHVAAPLNQGVLSLGLDQISAEAVEDHGDLLARCGAALAPGGGVVLWGANVCSHAASARLLAAMAHGMGRAVAGQEWLSEMPAEPLSLPAMPPPGWRTLHQATLRA